MEKQQAIVLRSYSPRNQQVTLFDKTIGKLDARAPGFIHRNHVMHHGAIIHYAAKKNGGMLTLDAIELIALPMQRASAHLEFVHHILELCYYYIPEGCQADELFMLVHNMLLWDRPFSSEERMTMSIKFFLHVGIYPEDLPFSTLEIQKLLTMPVSAHQHLYAFDESRHARIRNWLHRCFALHPNYHRFKTIAYGA